MRRVKVGKWFFSTCPNLEPSACLEESCTWEPECNSASSIEIRPLVFILPEMLLKVFDTVLYRKILELSLRTNFTVFSWCIRGTQFLNWFFFVFFWWVARTTGILYLALGKDESVLMRGRPYCLPWFALYLVQRAAFHTVCKFVMQNTQQNMYTIFAMKRLNFFPFDSARSNPSSPFWLTIPLACWTLGYWPGSPCNHYCRQR